MHQLLGYLSPAVIGYLGSALVFLSFWMKLPIRLRQIAVASNVAYITYGALAHLWPVLILHCTLLPLNGKRLYDLTRLKSQVERALSSDLNMEWLRPMMHRRNLGAGEYLFHQGDDQNEVYYILSGTIKLTEIDLAIGAGQLIGEMAVFTPTSKRTLSARCEGPVELLYMDTSDFLKLYYQNPDFGVFLVRLIARRLFQNIDHLKMLGSEREAQLERLRAIAKVDETTGIGDANAIYARLVAEWSRATRAPATLSVVVAQTLYEAGPAELTQIAAALSWCASRSTDFLGRDGSEFVAILPDTDAAAALAICREMRESVETLELSGPIALGTASCIPSREARPYSLVLEARDVAGIAQSA